MKSRWLLVELLALAQITIYFVYTRWYVRKETSIEQRFLRRQKHLVDCRDERRIAGLTGFF